MCILYEKNAHPRYCTPVLTGRSIGLLLAHAQGLAHNTRHKNASPHLELANERPEKAKVRARERAQSGCLRGQTWVLDALVPHGPASVVASLQVAVERASPLAPHIPASPLDVCTLRRLRRTSSRAPCLHCKPPITPPKKAFTPSSSQESLVTFPPNSAGGASSPHTPDSTTHQPPQKIKQKQTNRQTTKLWLPSAPPRCSRWWPSC